MDIDKIVDLSNLDDEYTKLVLNKYLNFFIERRNLLTKDEKNSEYLNSIQNLIDLLKKKRDSLNDLKEERLYRRSHV